MTDTPRGRYTVKVEVEKDEISPELSRLMRGFSPDTLTKLESKVLESRLETEVITHVETGSLKSTVRMDVEYDGAVWTGAVRAGGLAPGMPRDPVYYGVFELARGGDHFFLQPAYDKMGSSTMVDVIKGFYANKVASILNELD
jgi:hypothetical protein